MQNNLSRGKWYMVQGNENWEQDWKSTVGTTVVVNGAAFYKAKEERNVKWKK